MALLLAAEEDTLRVLWRRRAELERCIDLEANLQEAIKGASNSAEHMNYLEIAKTQKQAILANGSLIDQMRKLEEEKLRLNSLRKQTVDESAKPDEQLANRLAEISQDIKKIEAENDALLDEILNFDDDELHQLRAQKQHIDLMKRKFNPKPSDKHSADT